MQQHLQVQKGRAYSRISHSTFTLRKARCTDMHLSGDNRV